MKTITIVGDVLNKVTDTAEVFKFIAWNDGVPQDLTNRKIKATVANDSGYLFDIDIPSNGDEIDVDFSNNALKQLTAGNYRLEFNVTNADGDIEVYPSDGAVPFVVSRNLRNTSDELVPQITFDTVLEAVDKKVDEYVHTITKGDKGDTGDKGEQGIPATYQPNLLVNSDLLPGLQGWDTTNNSVGATPPYSSNASKDTNSRLVGFNTQGYTDRLTSRLKQTLNLMSSSSRVINSKIIVQWQSYVTTLTTFGNLYLSFFTGLNGTGEQVNITDVGNSLSKVGDSTAMWNWVDKSIPKYEVQQAIITIPPTARSVTVSFESVEGNLIYLTNPMVAFGDSISTYTSGAYYPQTDIKALQDHAVTDTGNQIIAGNKTFSGNTLIGGTLMTDTGWQDLSLESGATGTLKYRKKNGVVYVIGNELKGLSNGAKYAMLPADCLPVLNTYDGDICVAQNGEISKVSGNDDVDEQWNINTCFPVD